MNDLTDGELLKSFRVRNDEGAFAELMRRHGSTVLAAARTALGGASGAEDIAQATFLTLAKKAGSLDGERSLAGWLYRVSVNLAHNARRDATRRAVREREAAALDVESDNTSSIPEAAFVALREEIANLAEIYRAPLVLHHLEGRSYEDAASALGCRPDAFGVRLMRARQKLRKRLAGRGVTIGASALVVGLGQSVSAAELPATFVTSTCTAANALAAGGAVASGAISAKVAALMEDALKMLFWSKVKTVAAICAVAVLVGGAGVGVAVTLSLVPRQDAVQEGAGYVWAWGDNQCGQLGDGTTVNRVTPVQVPGIVDVTTVIAGTSHTVAIRTNHTVLAWGWNDKGQLGDGTTNNRVAPVPVRLSNEIPLSNIVAVAAGESHSAALTASGDVWTWGDNEFGQLGDGTTLRHLTPMQVSGLSGVIAIAAGGSHTVVLKDDRSVWIWGRNEAGQLGDGTTIDRHTPVQVKLTDGSPLAAAAIAAGRSHTAALVADGRVWGWGSNRNGQLGDDLAPRLTPGPVILTDGKSSSGVAAIAAAGNRTAALMDDGTVWIRGIPDQASGILDGLVSQMRKSEAPPRSDADANVANGQKGQFRPMQIKLTDGGALTGITAIVVGAYHAVALTADGGVWTWGRIDDMFAARRAESAAPLDPLKRGDGKLASHPVQTRMADGNPLGGVTAVAAGGGHTVVVVAERPVPETAISN